MSRQWVVSGRAYPEYDEFGAIVSTTVTLASQNDGYATFTETLSGDHTRKTNDELITLAKNQYFKKEYADYAMQDAVIKVDELERSIKKSEILQASLQTLITETKEHSVRNAKDLAAAESSRNIVFENIVKTINGYEQRLTNLVTTTNSFMEEVFAMLTTEEVPDGGTTEGSTTDTTGETADQIALKADKTYVDTVKQTVDNHTTSGDEDPTNTAPAVQYISNKDRKKK